MEDYKAYSLKGLGHELKEEGLEVLEESAEGVYTAFKNWLRNSAKKTKNPFDDIAVKFLGYLDKIVLPAIDKINPDDNIKESE